MTALALSPAKQFAQTEKTWLRWRDPATFAEEALDSPLYPHQIAWLDLMRGPDQFTLLEAPPGSAKTFVLRLYLLKLIANNPDCRVLLASASLPTARDSLRWVRDALVKDEVREVYGLEPAEPWTDTAFQLKRKSATHKEPTMRAVGLGGTVEGFRADLVVADDPIDEKSTYSQADRDSAERWMDMTFLRRMEPMGRAIVIGSPWVEDDVYDFLAKKRGFARHAFPALDENGDPRMPERLSKDVLDRIAQTDPYTFELKYRLNREAQKGGWDWKWVEKGLFTDDPADLSYTIGVDPALSPKGDYFALAVLGTDRQGVMHLVDLYLSRGLTAPAQVDLIIAKWKEWNAVSVGIEDVAYQGALLQHIQATAPGCPVLGVQLPQTAKEVKLQSLATLFSQGRIRVSGKLRELSSFRSQYLAFPKGKHDDALDAIWIAAQGAEQGGAGFTRVSW